LEKIFNTVYTFLLYSCINFEIFLQVHVCFIMHKSVTQPTFIPSLSE